MQGLQETEPEVRSGDWALTLCSRPRGFRILCILKTLSKPQEASKGFEGWHCNPRTLPASPLRQPSRRPGEAGRRQG